MVQRGTLVGTGPTVQRTDGSVAKYSGCCSSCLEFAAAVRVEVFSNGGKSLHFTLGHDAIGPPACCA